MNLLATEALDEINSGKGFTLDFKLSEQELSLMRSYIKQHSLEIVEKEAPDLLESYQSLPLNYYHELANPKTHSELWKKNNRIFPTHYLNKIKEFDFYKKLQSSFGPFTIANEEELFPEEVYWRFVRPNADGDVGPMHADKWFWDLGHGKMPEDCHRLKIWISIYCDPGGNGLRVAPYSQKQDYAYSSELRSGILKPVFDDSTIEEEITSLNSSPGDAVIFHDRLLHGGCKNLGATSRFSLEFTMLIPNKKQ